MWAVQAFSAEAITGDTFYIDTCMYKSHPPPITYGIPMNSYHQGTDPNETSEPNETNETNESNLTFQTNESNKILRLMRRIGRMR